jgi:hypothetical protein
MRIRRAPMPPLRRISDQLAEIRAPQQLAAAAAANLQKEADADSTHPPLGKRLANLGFTAIPSTGCSGPGRHRPVTAPRRAY